MGRRHVHVKVNVKLIQTELEIKLVTVFVKRDILQETFQAPEGLHNI